MTDIVLNPIANPNNTSLINDNFDKIETVVNEGLLHLEGGNNVMKQNIDMNSRSLLNVHTDVNLPNSLLTVTDGDARYYNVNGDSLTGPMNVGGNTVSGLPAAVGPTEPVRKQEFDAATFDSASTLRNDLANNSNPVKGAGQVGYAGTTVKAKLDDAVYKSTTSTITAQLNINGGGFGKIYDTDLWIAGANRANPTNNSQGLYVQHRVSGDLGGLVHDAAAAELRLSGASNTGTGQSAFEASLVSTGGVNNMGSINALLANFHTEGTPTGTLSEVALCRLSQIPPLAPGFTIGTAYGLVVDPQIVGAVNYGTYSLGQNVLGPIVPKDVNTVPVIARGLVGQVGALFATQNSGGSTLFSVAANGVVSVGGVLTGATFSVNNNNATGGTVASRVRAHPSQAVDVFQCQNSGGTPIAGINKVGAVYTALNTVPADADVVAGQCLFWFDSTNGAAKFMIKAKQADGTVRTAAIALT